MNKQRRKWISELIDKVTALKEEVDEVLQEEQDYFDNMPENLQYSERGENSQETISNIVCQVLNVLLSFNKLFTLPVRFSPAVQVCY